MVHAENATKKQLSESDILKAIYQRMGGKPSNFFKATVTPIHSDSYRVNIYTRKPSGDFDFLNICEIAYSDFYIVPD